MPSDKWSIPSPIQGRSSVTSGRDRQWAPAPVIQQYVAPYTAPPPPTQYVAPAPVNSLVSPGFNTVPEQKPLPKTKADGSLTPYGNALNQWAAESKINLDIEHAALWERAQANNMMINGLPVLWDGSRVSFDMDKIKTAFADVPDSAALIGNIMALGPATSFDLNDSGTYEEMIRPGRFGQGEGQILPAHAKNFFEPKSDNTLTKIGKTLLPIGMGAVFGGAALGVAGAFGSGATILGSGAAGAGAGVPGGVTAGSSQAAANAAASAAGGSVTAPAIGAAGAAGAGAAGAITAAGSAAAGGSAVSAIPWDTIIGVGGAIAGGAIQYSAAGKAADAVEDAADKAAETQLQMYYQSREDLAPWREAGGQAVNQLIDMVETGPGEFEASPGYQFALEEGLDAQTNVLSAMGKNRSGGHIKAATQYAENMASTEYDNFLARWYQSLTPYQSLAGLGLTGAQTTAQAGVGAAAGAAESQQYGGQAQGAGYINQGNVLSGAITGGANQFLYQNSLRNLQSGYQPYQAGAPNYTGQAVDQWQYSG